MYRPKHTTASKDAATARRGLDLVQAFMVQRQQEALVFREGMV